MESTTIYEKNNALFGDIEIQNIRSCENVTYLFTKCSPMRTFEQLVHKIELRHFNDESLHEGEK